MAKNILTEVSKDEEARAYYESQLIFELDQRGRINHAKKEAQLEIAKNMLIRETPLQFIIEDTGLSEDEVKTIKV